jgi:hypothetical protein
MIRAEFPASMYPGFAADLESCDGLLYLEGHALARLAGEAKKTADWRTYRRVMSLADTLQRRATSELLNILGVAVIEHLDFDGPNGAAAWECLSPPLQQTWQLLRPLVAKTAHIGKPKMRRRKR